MEFSARQIADLVGGSVIGDPDVKVSSFAGIENCGEGALSFLYDDKYEDYIYTAKNSVILVNSSFSPRQHLSSTLVSVEDPRLAVATLMKIYEQSKPRKCGIHPSAVVAESARIDASCYIGPGVCIGENVTIGKDTVIHPNAVIYDDCSIGQRCILHAGCVIGADGFGFQPRADRSGYEKIPQIGRVIIEDDVEIGANTCVDRATMGSTIVRKGVKLDNMVQIGHNVEIGRDTVISAQSGIGGSTRIGEWCVFGGQMGVGDHMIVADRTMAGGGSGITGSIKESGHTVMGYPAADIRPWWRMQASMRKLPALMQELESMKKEIARLRQLVDKENL